MTITNTVHEHQLKDGALQRESRGRTNPDVHAQTCMVPGLLGETYPRYLTQEQPALRERFPGQVEAYEQDDQDKIAVIAFGPVVSASVSLGADIAACRVGHYRPQLVVIFAIVVTISP